MVIAREKARDECVQRLDHMSHVEETNTISNMLVVRHYANCKRKEQGSQYTSRIAEFSTGFHLGRYLRRKVASNIQQREPSSHHFSHGSRKDLSFEAI